MTIYFAKLNEKAILPSRGSEDAAGLDLSYCGDEPITLASPFYDFYLETSRSFDPTFPAQTYVTPKVNENNHIALVPTGLAVAVPAGKYGAVCSRSGLAAKHGVHVLNAPGVIDSDYRGEIKVILINLGKTAFTINPGDRIAQLVVTPYYGALKQIENVELVNISDLSLTKRGTGGFGSTGITVTATAGGPGANNDVLVKRSG